jgi:HSP20 family protein
LGQSDERAHINIKETDGAFKVELAALGFSKEDFEVAIDGCCLHILAVNSSIEAEIKDHCTHQAFSYSSFQKSFMLTDSVKEEGVKAHYKDGVLRFNLTKKVASE